MPFHLRIWIWVSTVACSKLSKLPFHSLMGIYQGLWMKQKQHPSTRYKKIQFYSLIISITMLCLSFLTCSLMLKQAFIFKKVKWWRALRTFLLRKRRSYCILHVTILSFKMTSLKVIQSIKNASKLIHFITLIT